MSDVRLIIERAGLSWLIDRGVRGWAQYGLPEGGPLDKRAALAAWAWTGRTDGGKPWWLEIGPLPFVLRISRPMRVVLLGAVREVRLSGEALPASAGGVLGCCFQAQGGATLRLGPAPSCGPTYLTAQADLADPADDGLHHRGPMVRRMADGDAVALRFTDTPSAAGRKLILLGTRVTQYVQVPKDDVPLRFMAGPEYEAIRQNVHGVDGAVELRGEPVWRFGVSSQMDRQAVRLTPLQSDREWRMSTVSLAESSPTVTGLIQWPTGGRPMILRHDRQTMGGYPRLGSVIAADWRRLAWLKPGGSLVLRPVDRVEAMQAYGQEERVDRLLQQLLRLAGTAGD